MNKQCVIGTISALILGGIIGFYSVRLMQPTASKTRSEQHCALFHTMSALWAEHVLWTRQFIVSSVAGLKDASVAAQRLLKNQDDIGNAIVPFYGQQAGTQLTKLLREHITIAADIVKAAVADDTAQVTTRNKEWHRNAMDIATFLSDANPHWPKEALVNMLTMHLKLTTQELQDRMKEEWAADITNYDEVFAQAQMMGRALAEGIMRQFPDKF